jgi:hypothetical protein
MNEKIEEFFEQYQKSFNKALNEATEIDAQEMAQCFSDCFIAANPAGVACGKNDEELESQILRGLRFYRSIGTRSMNVLEIAVTALDRFHALARVRWQSQYRKKDGEGERIDFDVIYLPQINGERPRIFAYIIGDEEEALRERGLI